MEAALDEDAELVLVEALSELAPVVEEGEEDEAVEPMHPADLLTIMVAYMIENIGGQGKVHVPTVPSYEFSSIMMKV